MSSFPNRVADRTESIDSLVIGLAHDARMARHAVQVFSERHGDAGIAVAREAVEGMGAWRGGRIRQRMERAGGPIDAREMVRHWGTGELLGAAELGWGAVHGSAGEVVVELASTPECEQFRWHTMPELSFFYYDALYRGIAGALGEGFSVNVEPPLTEHGPVVATFRFQGATVGAAQPINDGHFATDEAADAVLQESAKGRGALYVLLGRAAENAFGDTGEQSFREAVRRFGAERGHALRTRHQLRGLPLTLKSLGENYDSGGNTTIWRWADEGELTHQVLHQDCVYCPYVSVWHDLDALKYGRIYDYEVHLAQLQAYNPDVVIAWGEIQSEGAPRCQFRYSLPSAPPEPVPLETIAAQ
jgi:hypothetical protein